MGDGVERRDLNGAEGAAGFRDHQVEEAINRRRRRPRIFVVLNVSRVRGVPA